MLTKRDVDRLAWNPTGPKIQMVPDGEMPGFSVRVYPSGQKAFLLRYRPVGAVQPRMLTLGIYGVLTVQQARDLARRALVEAKSGTDPQEERRKSRLGNTVRDLASVYIERHAKQHKKTWKEDLRRLDKYILPALGNRKVADVKRPDVARLHTMIGSTRPYEANRVLALMQVMFNKAEEWGLVDEGAPNPAARVQPYRERSRDRWVTPQELPSLVAAIDEEPNTYIAAAFRLYLLTGLRRSELLGLRWKDVDFNRREIRLEDTKAGRPHTVALSAQAIDELRDLPRMLGNDYVLPGHVHGRPLVNISKPWGRIRKRAGLEDVRLHDLRRTVGSWMAESGASLSLIGQVLNHSNVATTAVYARLSQGTARAALEEHGEQIGPLLKAAGAR